MKKSDALIELIRVDVTEKEILRNLMEKYYYDFSQYDDRDVNALGLFGCNYFDCYWTEKNRYVFFIKVDNQLAGFIRIDGFKELFDDIDYNLSDFFVLYKYRKRELVVLR